MKSNVNNQILNQLVLENCLRFGRDPKLNSRKNNQYIFGTREKLDIFKFYELRYLLLKVYPLIHNLFLQARVQVKKNKEFFFPKKLNFQTFARQLPKPLKRWKAFQQAKKKFNLSLLATSQMAKTQPRVPQILFATTNPAYSEIVSSAAEMCSMPFHTGRWVSGAMTAGFFSQKNQKKEPSFSMQTWFQNQTFKSEKSSAVQLMGKPSLIILPDVSNNEMILRETNILGIPSIGLVNSHCQSAIAYPIFANDNSASSIHFFCYFLSSLITKEMVKTQVKAKIVSKRTKHMQFPTALTNLWKFAAQRLKIKKKNKARGFRGFQGQYFLEKYVKPRFRIKKQARARWNFLAQIKRKKKEKDREFWMKEKKFPVVLMKKTIRQFQQSRSLGKIRKRKMRFPLKNLSFQYLFWKKPRRVKLASRQELLPYYLHKNTRRAILLSHLGPQLGKSRWKKKMNLVLQLRKYSFPQIKREIRLPSNLPKFHFWNSAATFYHRKSMEFATNTALGFRFRRFGFRKLNQKIFRQKNRAKHHPHRKFFWKKRKKLSWNRGYQGFQSTDYFRRSLRKMGLLRATLRPMRPAQNKNFRKHLSNKTSLYRKRWPSKKVKKK